MIHFFFFGARRGQFIEMVLSTRRPQASFLKTMIGVEASSVLVTIFLSANRSRSWNFCITLVLQGLAFLHDQQEVVGHEPPGGPVPLRGLVMPLPLAVLLVTKYGKHLS